MALWGVTLRDLCTREKTLPIRDSVANNLWPIVIIVVLGAHLQQRQPAKCASNGAVVHFLERWRRSLEGWMLESKPKVLGRGADVAAEQNPFGLVRAFLRCTLAIGVQRYDPILDVVNGGASVNHCVEGGYGIPSFFC